MRFHDAINGLFLIILGLAVLLVSRTFPLMPGQAIGPATFPVAIGAGLLLSGILVVAMSMRTSGRGRILVMEAGWRDSRKAWCVLFCLVGSLVLAVWFEQIGFPLGALVMCWSLFMLSGQRKPIVFVLAAGFIAVVTFLMTRVLSVPLPMGAWL